MEGEMAGSGTVVCQKCIASKTPYLALFFADPGRSHTG